MVIVIVSGCGGRLPDLHPVVRRKSRVWHALWRLAAYGGPYVMVRRYALSGGRITRCVVHIVLLTVMVVVHDNTTAANNATATTSKDAAATAKDSTAAATASAVPHVGRHVRVSEV